MFLQQNLYLDISQSALLFWNHFIVIIVMLLLFVHAATVIREEVGLSLDKAGKEVLGTASKVVLTKEMTTIVGDGTTQEAVNKRVVQIRNLIEVYI